MATPTKQADRQGRRRPSTISSPPQPNAEQPGFLARWLHSTIGRALTGSALLFAAFPPLGCWPLAWIAPAFWVSLIAERQLPGRRPYRAVWLAGFAFWLAVLNWLRLPHPMTSIGWVALSFYLSLYFPLFIALSRVAVQRLRWPVMVAAPVVWAGLELFQAHFLTGINIASISHSQAGQIHLIQIADLGGGYAVSFFVMFGAACLACCWPREGRRWQAWPLAPLTIVVASLLVYGHFRMAAGERRPGPTVSLIQGSIDTEIKNDPSESKRVFEQYCGLTQRALAEEPRPDLIVWPETMYRSSWITYSPDAHPASGDEDWTIDDVKQRAQFNQANLAELAKGFDAPLLLGIDTLDVGPGVMTRYNSALFVARDGQAGPRYDKMHPVVFGEYVPFAKTFPWLYSLTPLGGGIEPGVTSPVIRAGNARLAANICYETVLSHVIRAQVAELRQRGEEPDVLVNLTNDGWFWGSSELDLHLACGVFRAIECRKPLLIAANTGFSAWIDADGRVLARGPRQDTGWIIARPQLDNRQSPYLAYGDLPAGGCLAACVLLGGVGLIGRRKAGQSAKAAADGSEASTG